MQQTTHSTVNAPLKAVIGFLAAAAIALTGLAWSAPSAHAAEVSVQTANEKLAYVYANGEEEPIDITEGNVDVPVGTWLKFSTDWSIEGTVQNGDTFSIEIPEALNPLQTGTFPLTNSDGDTLATCIYTSTETPFAVTCTFSGAPAGGYLNPHGDMFIQLTSVETTEREDIEFVIGGNPVIIPEVGIGPPGMGHGTLRKRGTMSTYLDENGETTARGYWELMFIGGGPVTIVDELTSTAPNRPHTLLGWFALDRYEITEVHDDGSVEFDPTTKTRIDDAPEPTIAPDNRSFSVELPTLAGYLYVYSYNTQADGQVVEGEVFHNTATVNDTVIERSAEAEARADGTADATRLISFTISKTVVNEAQLELPEIVATSAAAGQDPYPMTVPGDGTAISSKYFPAGSPVEICETEPDVSGANWTHTFSGDGVVVNEETGCATIDPAGGSTVAIELTNTFEPTEPEKPETPEPGEPQVPKEPEQPANPEDPEGDDEQPRTPALVNTGGDQGLSIAAASLLLLAGSALLLARRRAKR